MPGNSRILIAVVLALAPASAVAGEKPMKTAQALPDVKLISVSIERPPEAVYDFASKPENLPKWATGLGGSIRRVNGAWIADSPMGQVKVTMAEPNRLGVLDHDVTLPNGETVHNAIRVVPTGSGSTVTFALVRQPGTADQRFAEDAAWVTKDLNLLKTLLEK